MQRRKGNPPTYIVRAQHGADKRFTTRIGAAWPFNDGDGYVVELDFVPLRTTTIILVPPKSEDDEEGDATRLPQDNSYDVTRGLPA